MKDKIFIVLLVLMMVLLIEGCKPIEKNLIEECRNVCKAALEGGKNLSNGPCLLDPMSNPAWVCDIAHEPRNATDNLKENQCKSWHNETAKHFIEFSPECKFIKSY